jgi:hypothetical protein
VTQVVERAEPFQVTLEEATKPLPFTWRPKAELPTVAVAG